MPTADIRHGVTSLPITGRPERLPNLPGMFECPIVKSPPMGNRVGLILGAVQSRIALVSRMLPSWIAKWSQEKPIMTDDQVNLVVQHLCEQLHLALRLKDSEAHPPNAKDIGFDPASVRTVLLTGLRSSGVTIHHEAAGASEEPPWS